MRHEAQGEEQADGRVEEKEEEDGGHASTASIAARCSDPEENGS